jgi:hypothetical protein
MAHVLMIPMQENGVITDAANVAAEIADAVKAPFAFTDVFIYSHGWWTDADDAMCNYNLFSIGLSKQIRTLIGKAPNPLAQITAAYTPLGLGLHWPSTLSEDQTSVLNVAEATSFFSMEYRADDVGETGVYALLCLLIDGRDGGAPLRFHFLGHSFGCRVVCSALQKLSADAGRMNKIGAAGHSFNVALIQAATDSDSLVAGKLYGGVLGAFPTLRLMVTKSRNDAALGTWYPRAQFLAHINQGETPAMGSTGPTGNMARGVTNQIVVLDGIEVPALGNFVVADLTALHNEHAAAYGNKGGWGGQHSDIYLGPIYDVVARFLFA